MGLLYNWPGGSLLVCLNVVSPVWNVWLEQTGSATVRILTLVPWPVDWELLCQGKPNVNHSNCFYLSEQCCIPGGIIEIRASSGTLKMLGWWILPHLHSVCLFGQRTDGSWRMIMDFLTRYDQSNCSCCTDVVSLLGQINTIFAIWFAAINLVDCSFFFFLYTF